MSLWGIFNCLKCLIYLFIIYYNIVYVYNNFSTLNVIVFKVFLFMAILYIIIYSNIIFHTELLEGIDKDRTIEGSLEINNVKLTGLEHAVKHIGTAAVYTTGITVGAGLLKSSSMPLGAKIAGTIGVGIASLVGFNLTQKAMSLDKKPGNIIVEADNMKSSINTNNSGVKPSSTASILENNETVNMSDITDVLHLNLLLHYVIIYLFIITFVLLIFRWLYNKNYQYSFLDKLPINKQIQNLLKKLLILSGKTNNVFIGILLITIFISSIICTYSLSVVMSKLILI